MKLFYPTKEFLSQDLSLMVSYMRSKSATHYMPDFLSTGVRSKIYDIDGNETSLTVEDFSNVMQGHNSMRA
jgi:glutamate-1-semialdehyde aminotransferase